MPLAGLGRVISSTDLELGSIGRLKRRRPIDGSLSYHQKRQLVPPQANIGQEMIVELVERIDGGLPAPFPEKLVKDLPQKDQHG
jgi:hypothetical protein